MSRLLHNYGLNGSWRDLNGGSHGAPRQEARSEGRRVEFPNEESKKEN